MCASRPRILVLAALSALLAYGPREPNAPARADAPKAGESKPAIRLPADPTAVVLSYDPGNGGFVRKGPPPYLAIRADARVVVTSPFDGSRKESKLTRRQLEDVLRFVIRDNEFFSLTQARIAEAVAKAAAKGPFIAVGGAGTSVIRVRANGKRHEVSYRAAGAYLRAYPKVRPLEQFAAVERRLAGLAASVAKAK
jgi:hypothetical protein